MVTAERLRTHDLEAVDGAALEVLAGEKSNVVLLLLLPALGLAGQRVGAVPRLLNRLLGARHLFF